MLNIFSLYLKIRERLINKDILVPSKIKVQLNSWDIVVFEKSYGKFLNKIAENYFSVLSNFFDLETWELENKNYYIEPVNFWEIEDWKIIEMSFFDIEETNDYVLKTNDNFQTFNSELLNQNFILPFFTESKWQDNITVNWDKIKTQEKIGFNEIIFWNNKLKVRFVPLKLDFFHSIDKILKLIDRVYFWWIFENKEISAKWGYKLVYSLYNFWNYEEIQRKIMYFYNQVLNHPIKKIKQIQKLDIAKRWLHNQNIQSIYKQQKKLLPGNDEKHKNWKAKKQNITIYGQDINLKNVKQYDNIDDFDILENRYIKKLIHKNMINSDSLEQKRFFNSFLNKKFFKEVKLDLSAKKTSKISLNLNYLNLEKYLKNYLELDILSFLNSRNVNKFSHLYEIYVFIKLFNYFSSKTAKNKDWEVVWNIKDIYKNWEFCTAGEENKNNCQRMYSETDAIPDCWLRLKYKWEEAFLSKWWCLDTRQWNENFTPDYILTVGNKKIVFDAKYSTMLNYSEWILDVLMSERVSVGKYINKTLDEYNIAKAVVFYPWYFSWTRNQLKKFIENQTKISNVIAFPMDEFDNNTEKKIIKLFFELIKSLIG